MIRKIIWAAGGIVLLWSIFFWFGPEQNQSNAAEARPFVNPLQASSQEVYPAIIGQDIIEDCGTSNQSIEETNSQHPDSNYVSLQWAPTNTMRCAARDSDNFVLTWTANDTLLTAYGDGFGVLPSKRGQKMSLGFLEVTGSATDYHAINLYPNIEVVAGSSQQGRWGIKASGLLSVDGVIYLWMRNVGVEKYDPNTEDVQEGRRCQLAKSEDGGATWVKANWYFKYFGTCNFVNYGMDYGMPPHVAAKHGDYVYMYTHDERTASAYIVGDGFIMARVPKDQIMVKEAYEYFIELDAQNEAVWDVDKTVTPEMLVRDSAYADRRVFINQGKAIRSSMIYNAAIDRYFWWQGYRNHVESSTAHDSGGFGIYDAPEPYGPWTTVYNVEQWDWGPGDLGTFPTKWISDDGLTMYLVFSGKDRFTVRRADLTLLVTPDPTPTPEPTDTPIPQDTHTPTNTPTNTPTPTHTPTPTFTPTATFTSIPGSGDGTPTNTPTHTPTPTPTHTPTLTPTPLLDDDNDGILSIYEGNSGSGIPVTLDTDADGILDYLDVDDDDDLILTIDEHGDPNGDGNPADATDTDGDGIPDYLDADDDNDGVATHVEGSSDRNDNGVPDHRDAQVSSFVFVPLNARAIAIATPTPLPVTRTYRLFNGNQDAEEMCNGRINFGVDNATDSIDLGVVDAVTCFAAFRYSSIRIPQGSTILDAYMVFESNINTPHGQSASLTFYAEASDNAREINSSNRNDITERPRTNADVGWRDIPGWGKNFTYSTPSLTPIIQELVNRPGWVSGNALMIIVTGEGSRQVESVNGDSDGAARLIVTFRSN